MVLSRSFSTVVGVMTVLCGASQAVIAAIPTYSFQTLVNFDGTNGLNPMATPSLDATGNVYGSTPGSNAHVGTVFKLTAQDGYAYSKIATLKQNGLYYSMPVDPAGNVYGFLQNGGISGDGTIFKLDAVNGYAVSTLATFNGNPNSTPMSNLLRDAAGNLYGATAATGYGTIVKANASNNFAISTLFAFDFATTGSGPHGFMMDASGNIYGTTIFSSPGNGAVYKLDAANSYQYTRLAAFTGSNGSRPNGAPVMDSLGNLYGTTQQGGASGFGTIYKLDASNNFALTTVISFNGSNGKQPNGDLLIDSAGNIYGTTESGGSSNRGSVFVLDAANQYALTTLWSFGLSGGYSPSGGLAMDATGNLFGVTVNSTGGAGTLFELLPIPEPASLTILAAAVVPLFMRARRRY